MKLKDILKANPKKTNERSDKYLERIATILLDEINTLTDNADELKKSISNYIDIEKKYKTLKKQFVDEQMKSAGLQKKIEEVTVKKETEIKQKTYTVRLKYSWRGFKAGETIKVSHEDWNQLRKFAIY